MALLLQIGGAAVASLGTLYFTTLTYSLRELSRARLAAYFDRAGDDHWLQATMDKRDELILVTAVGRLVCNTFLLVCTLLAFHYTGWELWQQYTAAVVVAGTITLLCSVALPNALARYSGAAIVGQSARTLHVLRAILSPI